MPCATDGTAERQKGFRRSRSGSGTASSGEKYQNEGALQLLSKLVRFLWTLLAIPPFATAFSAQHSVRSADSES
eukprot:IDg10220t1